MSRNVLALFVCALPLAAQQPSTSGFLLTYGLQNHADGAIWNGGVVENQRVRSIQGWHWTEGDRVAGPNRWEVTLENVMGDVAAPGVVLDLVGPETRSIRCAAVFVFVGVKPSSDVVGDLVVRNDRGFILTGPQLVATGGKLHPRWPLSRDPYLLETSVPGIFAVGDVRAGTIGRVAWAAAEGGAAVGQILEYLKGWDATARGAAEA